MGYDWQMMVYDGLLFIGYYIGVYTTWFCRPMNQESLDISDLTIDRTESVAFVLHIPRASPASGTGERGTCSMVNEVECIIEYKSREDKTQGIAPGTNNAPIGVFWFNLHDAFAKGRLNWIEKDIDFLHRTKMCHKLLQSFPLASQVVAPKRVPKKRCDPDRSTH